MSKSETTKGETMELARPLRLHLMPSRVPTIPPGTGGLDWARRMKRTYDLDVRVCPKCGGGMERLALIEDPRVARQILDHLGWPARAPPRGRHASLPLSHLYVCDCGATPLLPHSFP